jgi:hypothetical protein
MRSTRYVMALAAAACAVGALGGGTSAAHTTDIPSQLFLHATAGHDGFLANAIGAVDSKFDPKCVRNRELELRAATGASGWEVIDEGRSSRNGGFYLQGFLPATKSVKVKMDKKDVGEGAHKHVCTADTIAVPYAPERTGPTIGALGP